MRRKDFIRMGLKNLARRKLRTSLTVLGVVIGTFSIVAMMSLGIAMTENFNKQIMQMGSLTKITVNRYYYPETNDTDNWYPGQEKELDDNLVSKLKEIPHVKAVTPVQNVGVEFHLGKNKAWGNVYGISPDAFKYFDFPELEEGRYLTEEDTDALVCGAQAVEFYNINGYGKNSQDDVDIFNDRIKMSISANYGENAKPKYYNAKFVGKLTESNGDTNWNTYVNIEQMKKWLRELKKSGAKLYDDNGYSEIWVCVDDIKYVEEVQNQIKAMEYGTYSLADMVRPTQETYNTLQIILGGIGAVSMFVSAIGIANTMVMSIYERTKEIGVMKVLGCLVSDVRKLFLFEASLIGLIGGAIGVGLSYLISFIMNKYSPQIGGALGIGISGEKISIIPLWLVAVALVFSMLVGIISGYYPAKRATKIKAIEALRESN